MRRPRLATVYASIFAAAALLGGQPFSQAAEQSTIAAMSTPGSATSPSQTSSDTARVAPMISDALALMRANKNAEAADELKRAISISPNSAEAHHNYGLALAKLGNTQQATEELQKAIKIKPDLDSSWLTLGGLHQSLGHIDDAISLYKEFLKRFANRTDLNDTRAKISKLVDGLTQEFDTMKQAENNNEAIQGKSGKQAVIDGADDYVAEATRPGIVRWPANRMPIKIFIHDGNGVPGYKSQYKDILLRSFEDWSLASKGLIKFTLTDDPAGQKDIECYFVSVPRQDQGLKSDAEAGEANMYMDKDGIASGTIKVLTKSLSPVLPLTDNRMRVICLHEIGHALGLAGHTANPDDIMFYSTSFKDEWRNLSGRDARTIQRLYAQN